METPVPETSEDLETSLNCVPISFPLGEKIDNISSVTEFSDFEFETRQQNFKILKQTSNENDNPVLYREIGLAQNCNLPLPIKETLKANADMLVDKNILNHLLEPEYSDQMLTAPTTIKSSTNTNSVDPFLHRPNENNIFSENMNGHRYYHYENEKKEKTSVPYLSVNSTPKKSLKYSIAHSSSLIPQRVPTVLSADTKRVNFAPEVSELPRFSDQHSMRSVHGLHSFTSYGPEIVFNKLGEIRHHLDVKESNEDANLSDLPLSRLLVTKLNSQKQRTKDLEEELTLNEASLTKITCELEVVQNRLLRREEQLKEAGEQIGKLQNEWQNIQQKLLSSRDSYRNQNEQMKRTIQNLKQEKDAAESDLRILRDEQKQFSDLKVHAEGMKYEVEKSSKKNEEILQENLRLNNRLKMVEEKLEHYEKELLPKLENEMKNLEEENENLHSKLDNLTHLKNNVDEELKVLKHRHSAVLVKAVEDEELKKNAIQEKTASLEVVEKLRTEKSSIMEELHEEYQNQLQAILLKRITEIGVHFDVKERKLQEHFNGQIEDLKKSFNNEREGLRNRNLEEQEMLRKKHERENGQKDSVIRELKSENKHFRAQIEAIVNAISSVVPKAKDGASSHKDESASENIKRIAEYSRLRPSDLMNKFHLSHFSNLENGMKENGKEHHHHHMRSNNVQDFPGLPLIASTSLSCISNDGNDPASSEGEITSKGKKSYHRGKTKGRTLAHLQKPKLNLKAKFNGKKVRSAAQLLGSAESLLSSDKSCNSKFLREVDEEVSDLVQEINSMSEIMTSRCANETPRHDTSLDLDSAHLALKKIDIVSEKLSKYMTNN